MFEESPPRGKRRSCDSYEECLSEEIKKVRISYSPGELRLQSDLKDFEGSTAVTFTSCDDSSARVMTLLDVPDDCPCSFLVQISRHYPHKHPTVTCLDPGFCCDCIDSNGLVHHPELLENWVAVYSLINIVQAVRDIALSCQNDSSWRFSSIPTTGHATLELTDVHESMEETSL